MIGKGSIGMVAYFMRSHPWRSALMIVFLLLSGVVEGMSFAMFLPLVELATNGAAATSGLGRVVHDGFAAAGVKPELNVLLTLIVIGMTLKGLFLWFALNQVGYTIAQCAADLRLALIGSVLRAKWEYFSGRPVGHFASAISRDATVASNAYRNGALAIACLVQLVVYTIVALLVSWRTALLALAAGAAIGLILYRLVIMGRTAGHRQTRLVKSLIARLVDALNGIKPIKAMGCERHLVPLLQAETQGLNEAQRMKVLASQSLATFQEPLTIFILAIGLYVTMRLLGEPFSALLILAFLFSRLVNHINLLFRYVQAMSVGESAFWSMWQNIREGQEAEEDLGSGLPPPPLDKELLVDNVSFAYGDTPVLREVSLRVPKGQFVTIEGPSGCGKTTLADLIVGLLRPQAGDIRIDGVPLGDTDMAAWRRMIGYVPQEMFLFHDTILNNITLGDASISRADAEEALRRAGAWEFVERLPEGMDTVVGERGSKLSGGQRQRIALARALARNPRLLVLDEVTASLDPETEAGICETLRALRDRVTIVAVSHQPAVVRVADAVYRLGEQKESS